MPIKITGKGLNQVAERKVGPINMAERWVVSPKGGWEKNGPMLSAIRDLCLRILRRVEVCYTEV